MIILAEMANDHKLEGGGEKAEEEGVGFQRWQRSSKQRAHAYAKAFNFFRAGKTSKGLPPIGHCA